MGRDTEKRKMGPSSPQPRGRSALPQTWIHSKTGQHIKCAVFSQEKMPPSPHSPAVHSMAPSHLGGSKVKGPGVGQSDVNAAPHRGSLGCLHVSGGHHSVRRIKELPLC